MSTRQPMSAESRALLRMHLTQMREMWDAERVELSTSAIRVVVTEDHTAIVPTYMYSVPVEIVIDGQEDEDELAA